MSGPAVDEGLTALFRGDPQLMRDPYPFYRRLREAAPVHRLGSLVVVSTHAEAKAAYRDNRRLVNRPAATTVPDDDLSLLSSAGRRTYDELLEFELGYMSRKDGLDHARVRSAAQPAFTPRRVDELGELTQQLTDELVDELCRKEAPDLIELAYRLPLLVLTSMLGAPREDAELVKGWGDDMNGRRRQMPVQPELVRRAGRGLAEYRAYVGALVEGGTPGTELAAALLAAEEGERLTRDELVATYVLLLFAGHETTTNLIGNGLLALLRDRDQWQLLCDDPSLAPSAVEEAFRYDAPVQISPRHAAADLELGGVEIPVGATLLLLIGSANRDAKAFSDPDELDVTRRPNDHLGLGHGVHFCLGGPLARLQAQVVFSTLARRLPGLELAADPDALPRSTHPSMRGLVSLPVKRGSHRSRHGRRALGRRAAGTPRG